MDFNNGFGLVLFLDFGVLLRIDLFLYFGGGGVIFLDVIGWDRFVNLFVGYSYFSIFLV